MSDSPKEGKRNLFVAPTFSKPLRDLSTTQGECLVLECRVKGVPPPSITWKREGAEVEDSSDFRMLHRGEVATLVIGEAFPEDTGVFTCEATNKAGKASSSCKVVVKGGAHLHSISTKSAATGQGFTQPRPTQVLPTQQSSAGSVPDEDSLNHPSQFHQSQSHTSPTNQHLNGDKSAINGKNDSPLLRNAERHLTSSSTPTPHSSSPMATTAAYNSQNAVPDENQNFKSEKDQLIQAVSQSFTTPKQGRQNNQGDYILYSPTLAAILEIEPQEYKISSFDQRLMNEIEYRLERTPPVNEDPEDAIFEDVPVAQQIAPTFVANLKNFKAMDGTSTKFTCRVTAKPSAKVFWFKDGKQISKRSQHYLQRSDGEGGYELFVPQLHMDDDGNYTALATNPQGRASSTGRLAMVSEKHNSYANDVTSPPPHVARQRVPAKGQLADDEECPVDKYYRPTFIQKPPENTKSVEGKLVRFDIKVTGLPLPAIEWLINGRPVRQDVLHKILVRENNVHSLLLERVSPMDEGQYTIKATNKAGTAVAHIQLHVTPREHMTAPAFIQRLTGHCVAEGEPVRLEARVVATPRAVISWKRGADQIMHDSRTQLYEDESGYVCLQITQAHLSDAAWYTCSATNKAGISSCNCKLDVYSPTANIPSSKRRIRTPHRYANLAKVAGVDMREALTPDAQAHHMLPESEEL